MMTVGRKFARVIPRLQFSERVCNFRMISPFGPMIRVPGGTLFTLNSFGGADSSHFSTSKPSGVTKRSTALGFGRWT